MSQLFVAFSEYLNFKLVWSIFGSCWVGLGPQGKKRVGKGRGDLKMGPKMYLVNPNEPNLNPILGRFGPLCLVLLQVPKYFVLVQIFCARTKIYLHIAAVTYILCQTKR